MAHCRELQLVQDQACNLKGELAAAEVAAAGEALLQEESERKLTRLVKAQQFSESSKAELYSATEKLLEKEQIIIEAQNTAHAAQTQITQLGNELKEVKSDLDEGVDLVY